MRVLAGLFQTVEATTLYGGMAVSHEPLGSAWLRLGARRRRERTDAGMTRGVEVVVAETRCDPRLIAGRVLRFGGTDWRIEAVDAGETPGRMALNLERTR